MDAEQGQSSYFARGEQSFYAEKRARNDFGWTIAYCLWAALTVFWGIAAFTHTDPNAADYTNGFYWNSATCSIDDWKAYQATLPPTELIVDPTFGQAFNQQISIWLPISAVVALVCSAVYVLLFRKYAKTMVYLSIYFSLGCSAAWAILCLAFGAVPFGIILLIVTVISAFFYWWIRNQLAMCAKLMSVAGRGLSDNVGLVPASLGIKVAGLAVLVYALAAFGSAVNIGTVGANAMVASRAVVSNTNGQAAVCTDAQGMEVACCSMNTAGWAGAYCFVCAIFILWTWMIVMQVRLYTVADTTAQWYFSATGSSASVGSAANAPGSVRLALRHALTSSFGSIAFAAAILTALRIIRNTMRRCARDNIICCIINCFVQPLLALAEKFTSFATIAVAITGKSFVAAATSVFETLKRNFLQTYSVWWVPEMVLNTAAFLVSLAWAGLVYFGAYMAKKDVGVGFLVAFICFLAMWFVLQFVAGLLLDVVNTLYICYAMDRDAKKVTNAEIHAIYNEVPTIAGGVVVNPDGGVMYGAADQQQQQQLAPQQVVVQMHPVAPPPYPGAAPQPTYGASAGYAAPGAYPGYAPVATAQPAAPYPAVQPAGSYQPFPTDKL